MAPKGWPVIAINPNDPAAQPGDSFDKMIERAKEKNFPLNTCLMKDSMFILTMVLPEHLMCFCWIKQGKFVTSGPLMIVPVTQRQ